MSDLSLLTGYFVMQRHFDSSLPKNRVQAKPAAAGVGQRARAVEARRDVDGRMGVPRTRRAASCSQHYCCQNRQRASHARNGSGRNANEWGGVLKLEHESADL